ncbi:MAG TPA: PadR family transcriptional regulator [Vicinamibacterales bacterium]|jgi:PadR family transcriptional regulator PadR|nr:PadR family transcriptional regulator [Vicinamibacterales bacterium]
MAKRNLEVLKGTLHLLVLRTVELQPLHGVGIAGRIRQVTRGTFEVGAGSLFPALHRLEQEGLIEGSWGETDEGRRARFYRLTPAGARRLETEKKNWNRIVFAISQVLENS